MPPPFSGSLLTKNRAALDEIAHAMQLDTHAAKLRTDVLDLIRHALLARQQEFIDDPRFAKLYVRAKAGGRPSSRATPTTSGSSDGSSSDPHVKVEQEGDLTAEVNVPEVTSSAPLPSSPSPYLSTSTPSRAAAAAAAVPSSARRTPRTEGTRRSARLSVEPRSPAGGRRLGPNHEEEDGEGRKTAGEDEEDEEDDDDNEDEEQSLANGSSPALSAADEDDAMPGSHALTSLTSPLKSALAHLASPLKPALAALSSPASSRPARAAVRALGADVGQTLKHARDGAVDRVQGVVHGAGFSVHELADEAEDQVGRRARAAKDAVVDEVHGVEDGLARAFRRAVGAVARLRSDAAGAAERALGSPTTQALVLLALEGAFLALSLVPWEERVASFPPRLRLLAPADVRTDYAELYPPPPPRREPWATLAYAAPRAPADPLALAAALGLWALATIALPAAAAGVLASPPTDRHLVFFLVRCAALALGHAGWRAHGGFGSGPGRVAVVGSALGAGLAVARGLGEARVGGVGR